MKSEKYEDKKGTLNRKSFAFALRIVKMTKYLQEKQHEHVLSKQVLRSGTAVGALVRESEYAQSPADFANKLSIALKEANETDYWLALLKEAEYIDNSSFTSLRTDCKELIAILVSSINTIKNRKDGKK